MSFVVRVLVVEDTDAEIKNWEKEIEYHNAADNPVFIIQAIYAKSLRETREYLASHDFHAAIVDINLQQENMTASNSDGNKAIESLLDLELAVVAVFTGESPLVEIPEWAKNTVRTFRKGAEDHEGTSAVMGWLGEQVPLIKAVSQAQSIINAEMVKLFTRSIWPRWSHWTSEENDGIEISLSRHLAAHIHATLLEGGNHQAHPEEWYFVPPVREGIRTGDLIKIGDKFEIVITPRCDLATGKVNTIQLAKCQLVQAKWRELCDALAAKQVDLNENTDPGKTQSLEKKIEAAKKALRKYTQHNGPTASLHFLPPIRMESGELGPFMVSFNDIRTVLNTSEFEEEEKRIEEEIDSIKTGRIAALTPEFLPSFIERLGAYFSRIGTPDYSHPE